MRVVIGLSLICAIMWAGLARAEPPLTSIRPQPREVEAWRTTAISQVHNPRIVKVYYRSTIRPQPRLKIGYVQVLEPVDVITRSVDVPTGALASTRPVYRSPRPINRPQGLVSSFKRKTYAPQPVRVASTKPTATTKAGALCGDARIRGEVLAPIAGALPGCGLANPVRVHSVDGVVLGQQSIMDCQTAKTLRGWVSNSLKPLIHRRGGGVKSLSVPSHYSCRTRNSQKGAKISEHGKGHAIDISAINLKDGTKITVLDGWKNYKDKKILKRLHASACGPFGTVLGPEANKFHLDHFHFDTARYRGGAYCE
jgi:hypothetical protein